MRTISQYIRAAVNFDLQKTPRNDALCCHVVDSGLPLIIADTRADEHFADHPLVTGTPYIRFYAGVPLVDSEGNIPGSFCVTDTVPHAFTQAQQATLTTMAELVMKFQESWHFAGFTDPVTGLPNRQRLIHDLQELSRAGDTHDRRLILIDGIDMPRAYELARSMGMTPVETLLRDIKAFLSGSYSSNGTNGSIPLPPGVLPSWFRLVTSGMPGRWLPGCRG